MYTSHRRGIFSLLCRRLLDETDEYRFAIARDNFEMANVAPTWLRSN